MEGTRRERIIFFLVVVFLSTLLGSVLGEILGVLVPEGAGRNLLSKGVNPTLEPFTLNLVVLTLTLGVGVKINLCSLLGFLLGIWIYRKV